MEAKLRKRLEKRRRLYAFVGKQKFARDAYKLKIDIQKKEASEKWQACLSKVKSECDYSITTLSILKWWRLHETGDLTNLLKVKRDIDKIEANALNLLYKNMREEFFAEFGLGEELIKQGELMKEIILLTNEMIQNDDISLLNDIEEKQEELKKLQNKNTNKASLLEVAANVRKIVGVEININTCTVGDFFTYINMIKK